MEKNDELNFIEFKLNGEKEVTVDEEFLFSQLIIKQKEIESLEKEKEKLKRENEILTTYVFIFIACFIFSLFLNGIFVNLLSKYN